MSASKGKHDLTNAEAYTPAQDADTEKRGWDPTDPDPANPWDDAFESGTAIRSQAAWDQWETERENWMSSLTPTDLQGWSTDSKIAGTRG